MTKIKPKRVLTVCEGTGLLQDIRGFSQVVYICVEHNEPGAIGGLTFEVVDREYANALELEIEKLNEEIKKLRTSEERV